MLTPTVAEVLDLPETLRGEPELLAGEAATSNRVRWVHVSELADIGPLLTGGELILTTGLGLPDRPAGLRQYVQGLSEAGISGLLIELGRKFRSLPPALINAAEAANLPLVALHNEVRFVSITEAVHSRIIDAQSAELRMAKEVHTRFTDLTLEGASPREILEEISRLTGLPVILENLTHQILAYAAATSDADRLLKGWEQRSRRIRNDLSSPVVTSGGATWLVTALEVRGDVAGRLLMRLDDTTASNLQQTALERGAIALALNRLVDRDRETLEREAHRTLLSDIVTGSYSSTAEVLLRAEALGVSMSDRILRVAVARVVLDEEHSDSVEVEASMRGYAEDFASAVRENGVPALVGSVGPNQIGAILSLPKGTDTSLALEGVARSLHREASRQSGSGEVVVGAGSEVDAVRMLRQSLQEAVQVADAAVGLNRGKLYYEALDIDTAGLLYLLREDARLQAFVERQLSPLLVEDDAHGTELLVTLRTYLQSGANKSQAAGELGISRPTLYHRLERIQSLTRGGLDSPDRRLSLHVALLALDAVRPRP